MTTNTTSTASQAPAVTIDTPEFRQKLAKLVDATHGAFHTAIEELIVHIDAKLAQIEDAGWTAGRQQCYIDALERSAVAGLTHDRDGWKARATAAEAKLEAIRQVPTWQNRVAKSAHSDCTCLPAGIQCELMKAEIKELRALLQPQPQADESGLPG